MTYYPANRRYQAKNILKELAKRELPEWQRAERARECAESGEVDWDALLEQARREAVESGEAGKLAREVKRQFGIDPDAPTGE